MSDAAENIQRAAQLYDMRDKAKRLLGDRYASEMAVLGRFLSKIVERDGKDVLSVAIGVCEKRALDGMEKMLVMAAAVELVEPTQMQVARGKTQAP